jgi:hypothetical protein
MFCSSFPLECTLIDIFLLLALPNWHAFCGSTCTGTDIGLRNNQNCESHPNFTRFTLEITD